MGKNQAVEKAEYFAESIGRMAYQALLEEVYTVPKPGLVDPYSCGAHTDMDVEELSRVMEQRMRIIFMEKFHVSEI